MTRQFSFSEKKNDIQNEKNIIPRNCKLFFTKKAKFWED